MPSRGQSATLIAYTGTTPEAPLFGGVDPVTGRALQVFWAGSTLPMAMQFQDGEVRKLQIELKHPLIIPDEAREAMCGKLSHARIAEQTHAQVLKGNLPYDGIIFQDTADGMEVADVIVVFPKLSSVDHAVKVIGRMTFDDEKDDWVTTPGFDSESETPIALATPYEDETIASNGQSVRENFAAWFDDSVFTHPDGTPRVFFHGTQSDFDEFRQNDWTAGYFFTDDPMYAEERAVDDAENVFENAENIVPVFLSARKVLDVRRGLAAGDERALLKAGADPESLDWIRTPEQDQYYVFAKDLGGEAFVAACLRAGFDGIVFNEIESSDPMPAYAVFSPTQIKSAIGNSGLYLHHSASMTDHEAALALKNAADAKSYLEVRQGRQRVFACEGVSDAKGARP